MVELAAAMGMTQEEMRLLIPNPETGKPIDRNTLMSAFRDELDTGHMRAHLKVGLGLFRNATTATPLHPGGNPICQFFWLKCRLRWKQNYEGEEEIPPLLVERADDLEIARRILFVAERVKREQTKALPSPAKRNREVA